MEDESDCPNEQDNGIKTGDTPEKGKDKGKDGKDKDSKVGKDKKLKKKASRRGSLDALDKNQEQITTKTATKIVSLMYLYLYYVN